MPYKLSEAVKEAMEVMNLAIAEEFSAQGHTLTGAAERSLAFKIKELNNRVTAEGLAIAFMKKLNDGIPPDEVKVDSKYLDELTKYVNLRMGIYGRKAVQVAYRIALKHKREGVPTADSSRFSKTGERTHFINKASNDSQVDKVMSTGIDTNMDQFFSQQKSEKI
ncbi:MAG TPA: hypothetical protein DCQ29_03440 [Chitinophagaceae bacterium]|nr:hypothetical protein [Chitinophagaceae bacterium]